MKQLLLALSLSTVGVVRDEGYCIDKRALVLTEAEAIEITALAARAAAASRLAAVVLADLATAKRDLATAKDQCAAALEANALLLSAPRCSCSEWQSGLIGGGVGVLSCGALWMGSRL